MSLQQATRRTLAPRSAAGCAGLPSLRVTEREQHLEIRALDRNVYPVQKFSYGGSVSPPKRAADPCLNHDPVSR